MLKIFTTGIVALSLLVGLNAQAHAYFFSFVNISVNSIDCDALIKGARNVDKDNLIFECEAQIKEAELMCTNQPGNAGNSGSFIFDPFLLPIVTGDQQGTDFKNEGKGKVSAEAVITDAQIQEAVAEFLPDAGEVCPNDNWNIEVGDVTKLCATVRLFSCDENDCTTLELEECLDCVLPAGSTTYACMEIACPPAV